jgi:bifunctional pyridoxal-dependent enzyme with beta-cystathionase and maltose regulon repressor activities
MLAWLCSPNNPTGFILSQAEVDQFMERLPGHVVVVFDEAYCDFVTDPDYADSIRYVRQGRNVIVVRSFSKSGGLANLRSLSTPARQRQSPLPPAWTIIRSAIAVGNWCNGDGLFYMPACQRWG